LVAHSSTDSILTTINVPTTRFYVQEDGQLHSSTRKVQVILDNANYQHHNPTLDFDAPLEFGASDTEAAPSLSSINDAFAELAAIDPAYFDELDEITLGPRKKRPSMRKSNTSHSSTDSGQNPGIPEESDGIQEFWQN
jgi:hypothetical protein